MIIIAMYFKGIAKFRIDKTLLCIKNAENNQILKKKIISLNVNFANLL